MYRTNSIRITAVHTLMLIAGLILGCRTGIAQSQDEPFKVIAFFTAERDRAHITFVHEANRWLASAAQQYGFTYDSTSDWRQMNDQTLAKYQVVLFLDTRPETSAQREAFRHYIENGGGWIGFHFAGFALNQSDYPQNWDWYHKTFLGSDEYLSNTWRPTSAVLRVEDKNHPVTQSLPETWSSAPNEWYRWTGKLTENPHIKILISIDPSSFPLGTGPKPHEIWQSGYYPVVWTNTQYNMLYMNMGHNDIDYENKTNKQLSYTFENPLQNQLLINALRWLASQQEKNTH